jgi:hypothetical protein
MIDTSLSFAMWKHLFLREWRNMFAGEDWGTWCSYGWWL